MHQAGGVFLFHADADIADVDIADVDIRVTSSLCYLVTLAAIYTNGGYG
ncbi:MAG: hypothetical protein JXA33_09855 [Anaerolineae bacterium]|nr:hypothetical protein [Anaerolineae bacterium]